MCITKKKAQISNATQAYKYEDKIIYRTFDVVKQIMLCISP